MNPQNRYKVDLREIHFLLFEQLGVGKILGKPPFEGWDEVRVSSLLAEAYDFVREHLGPLRATSDREGCHFENGRVYSPSGFKEAWAALAGRRYKWLGAEVQSGGAGAPRMVQAVVDEMIAGANPSFSMYSTLGCGAAEVLLHFGTERQKQHYLGRLSSGQWAGTMCLTEPQAGSSIGDARTVAKRLPDGRYRIAGTKIFISAGDHDMAENIVHLVLARTKEAPPGTKGLSLFIVPKYHTNNEGALLQVNDVVVGGVEEMMGLHGSATCVLNFGENEGCIGELVGPVEHQAMSQMFHLMNGARISVGVHSIGIASSAYLNALDIARDGGLLDTMPSSPSELWAEALHVRQLLLEMKARTEGTRALIAKLGWHQDMARAAGDDAASSAYHQGQVDLLVPLAKAYCSEQARLVCELAIRSSGQTGLTLECPLEQAYRDAQAFSFYEGTNHVHAMDLIGRKLGQHGGRNLQMFLGELHAFVRQNADHPSLRACVAELGRAQVALARIVMKLLMWFQLGMIALNPIAANRVVEMLGEVVVGWLLLDGARIACDALARLPASAGKERAFYEGKKQAALFHARNILPNVVATAHTLMAEDDSAVAIAIGSYSTT